MRSVLLISIVLIATVSTKIAIGEDDSKPFGLKTRVPWTTSRVVGTPEPPPPYTVKRAFPKIDFKGPVFIAAEPGTKRYMVGESSGKIYAFTQETPDTKARELFLDIGRDLYAFSFHPNYEKNGTVFTFSPRDPKDKAKDKDRKSRVSRYRATGDNRRCLPETEEIIIEWPAGGHNGGEAIIGPDGYLYVSTGDSTSGSDPKNTGQGVDDLLSVIMRLDVDNPAKGKAYSIPQDNPFVSHPGARPEIWAFGFRNPWRMSFDKKTGRLWVGDVGQDLWEMIWIVKRGGNYGWSVQEGTYPFHPNKPIGPGPILPPVVEHHHTVCRSITGGYVYHGDRFPELEGVYVYGDYQYGMIWGVRSDNEKATAKLLANTTLGISSFGVAPDGHIYLLDHTGGHVYELARSAKVDASHNFPRKLSETGLFASTKDHKVAPGLIPYSVNTPQWTDNAIKERFIAVPGESKITFGEDGPWGFDDGAVNVETISIEMELGNLKSRRRLETRILVKQENHWLGYSYLWNKEQSDGTLVAAKGHDISLTIKDKSVAGGKRQQAWHVPSRNECMFCHSRAAGFVLGVGTVQLNRDHQYGDVLDNQLRSLAHIGVFKGELSKKPEQFGAHPDVYDSGGDLNTRARAYLHVNCSVCHVSDGGGNAKIQLKYTQSLKDSKLTDAAIHGTFGLNNAKIVVPGDPYASVLFYRLSKWGLGRMPHVGSNLHDEKGLDLIHDWIAQLPSTDESKAASKITNRQEFESTSKALTALEQANPEQRADSIRGMISSTRGAFILARAIGQQSALSKTRQQAIAMAVAHTNPNVRDLFERFLPLEQRTKRLGDVINVADILKLKGDAASGRSFFFSATASQCNNCHKIDNKGGDIGPDLSQIGEKYKPHEIVESLTEPSRKIEPKFQTYVLATSDGAVHKGILVEKTEKEVALKVYKDGKVSLLRVPASEVDDLVVQKQSIMPDALLKNMTPQEAADLLAFLVSLKKQ